MGRTQLRSADLLMLKRFLFCLRPWLASRIYTIIDVKLISPLGPEVGEHE